MRDQFKTLNQKDHDRVAEKVFAAQINLLYEQLPIAVISSLAVISCAAFILAGMISSTTLVIWYFAFVMVTLARYWLLMRYRQQPTQDYQRLARLYTVSAFLGGALIGFMPIITTHEPVEIQSFVLFIIAGLCAGGLSTHASMARVFSAFLIPATMIPSLWFFYQNDLYHLTSGMVILLLALFMARSCHNYAKTLENALRLQFSSEIMNIHLAAARDAAETAYKAKSVFLSSMSHELRTPINAILGFAQLLDEEESPGEEQSEYMQQIKKAGHHLLDLINSILDLAKLEADKMEVFPIQMRLGDVVNECVRIISPIASQAGIRIEDNASDCDIEVVVDYLRMKQVILNLLSNAIKYNKDGGRVILEPPEARDGFCHLAITDTGIGLTPRQMREIFLPFNRAAEDHSNIEGTGIGLNITSSLLELMGGHIGVRSEVGTGSTFWIEVPLAKEPVSEADHSSP